jgi:hypothetical protein
MSIDTSVLFKSLRYSVEVTYDNGTDECECGNDYCRCSTIVNAKVDYIPCERLAKEIVSDNLLLQYCVERILTHYKPLRDNDNWDIKVEGGYYGEELGDVTLNKDVAETLSNILMSLDGATNNQIVETALQVEYGFILPTLKDKKWTLTSIAIFLLDLGNEHHAANLDDDRVLTYRLTEPDVVGLVIETEGKFRVIDGYHRITAAKKDGKSVVWVVMGQ